MESCGWFVSSPKSVAMLCVPLSPMKGEGKIHPRTGHKGPEREYISTLSLTSVLDGGGWSMPRPGRFTPGKDPVSVV